MPEPLKEYFRGFFCSNMEQYAHNFRQERNGAGQSGEKISGDVDLLLLQRPDRCPDK
jgi:hypothetical protein